MKIAIVSPSRKRPKELLRFYNSVCETVNGNYEIDFLVGIDDDDPTVLDYYDIFHSMVKHKIPKVNVLLYQDRLPSVGHIWNALVNIRPERTRADIFIMANDDLVYDTYAWDDLLVAKVKSLDHPYHVLWFNDKHNEANHCAFPIVTKQWISAIGYFTPECFQFFYHDTWVFDVAKRAEVEVYMPDVTIQHLHFAFGTAPYDNTYGINRDNGQNTSDNLIYKQLHLARESEAKKILQEIENYKTKKHSI